VATVRASVLLLATLALSASWGDEAPAPTPPPPATPPQAPPPEATPAPPVFSLDVTARIEPAPKDASKHVVVVEGTTSLPNKTQVSLHLYVTYARRNGEERITFVDGRSTSVLDGKFTYAMGPSVMAMGTYRLEAVVDPQRQYADVEKVLKGAQIPRSKVEIRLGTDDEIALEREIGRPRALHAAELILTLRTELLGHSKDLQGPGLEEGDWEAPWLHHVRHLCGRLRPQSGEVVGRNQVSRPLAEPFDRTDSACFDALRAMLKAHETLSPPPVEVKTPGGEGNPPKDIPPWTGPADAPALEALTVRVMDAISSDYEQDLLLRLEAMVKTSKDLHRDVMTPKDPAAPRQRFDPKQLWAQRLPAWLEDCRQLREELSLLTDEASPRPFFKQMARRLIPLREQNLALAGETETVLKGLARSVSTGKTPEDEVAQALDRFYAGYATLLFAQMSRNEP